MTATRIARLHVTLNDVEPSARRRVEAPLAIRLDRLRLVLQAALGWTNSPLYEIKARDVGWGLPDPDFGDGPLDAKKARLVDVLEDAGTKTVKCLYGFGDGWERTVKVERITDAMPGVAYPVLINATGRCPPEDVGGPWGCDEFLDALADPAHENHAKMKNWIGENFVPTAVDVEALADDVAARAKAWTRKPSAKRKSTNWSAASTGWIPPIAIISRRKRIISSSPCTMQSGSCGSVRHAVRRSAALRRCSTSRVPESISAYAICRSIRSADSQKSGSKMSPLGVHSKSHAETCHVNLQSL